MRTLVLNFDSQNNFEKVYLDNDSGGGVFVETVDDFTLGEMVRLYLCFPEIPEGVPLEGRIVWRRPPTKWRSRLLPGIGICFNLDQKNRKEFLLDYSKGRVMTRRRKDRRIVAAFPVEFSQAGDWVSGRTENLSREGVFINTDVSVYPGTKVQLRLYLRGQKTPDTFFGKVAWESDLDSLSGLGVEFSFRSPIQRKVIHNFINKKEDRLIERIPDMSRTSSRNLV
jgi:Tfp pilus assembly protein PilZ